MTEERKDPPIKLPPLKYSNLGALSVEGLRMNISAGRATDPYRASIMQEEEAQARVDQLNAARNPTNDPTLIPKARLTEIEVGKTYMHKERGRRVTIIKCAVKRADDGTPMHLVIDDRDNRFRAREDLLEK